MASNYLANENKKKHNIVLAIATNRANEDTHRRCQSISASDLYLYHLWSRKLLNVYFYRPMLEILQTVFKFKHREFRVL